MTNTTHPVLQEIIAKAWADEAFKKQLETNPAEVLKQAGLPVPKNQKIEVVSNTEDVMYLVLPLPPEKADFDVIAPQGFSAQQAHDDDKIGDITIRCGSCCSLDEVIKNHG
jgi:hypothetical protein